MALIEIITQQLITLHYQKNKSFIEITITSKYWPLYFFMFYDAKG